MQMKDLDEFVALHSDPEFVRFVVPLDRAQSERRLLANEREWQERGHGMFAVIARASARFLGRVGLKYWPEFDETEVGWALRSDSWGRGYATEAAGATIAWGLRAFDVPYLTAMIRPANARSIAVAERLGMAPLRSDVFLGGEVIVYALGRK